MRRSAAVLSLVLCFLCFACSSGSSSSPSTDTVGPDTSPAPDVSTTPDVVPSIDTAPGEDVVPPVDVPPVHALTGATPQVEGARLTEEHEGWEQASCMTCHDAEHGGTRSDHCAVCHGGNGAPLRVAGHEDSACGGCHGDEHEGADFHGDVASCKVCHGFAEPTDCESTESYDVVVVGSGGGGLGAASTLAQAGLKVLVLEKHNKVGGYMTNFERGDYRFEISLHAMAGIEEGAPPYAMFERLGISDRVTPVKTDPMYRAVLPSVQMDIPADIVEMEARLEEAFPHEAENIDAFFRLADDVDEAFDALMAMLAGDSTALDALMAENPEAITTIIGYLNATLGTLMRDFFTDEALMGLMTQLASYIGVRPDEASAALFIVMWNSYARTGFYNFVGGSQSISDALADVIRENGGRIQLGAMVDDIVIEDGVATRVETTDGGCYRARYVVSNVNAPAMVELIGRDNLPEDYVADIDSAKEAISIFVLYLGVDHDYVPLMGHTHEIIAQTSDDMNASYDAIEACNVDDTILLITNYSVIDATAAPEGKNVITITGGLDYDCNEQWQWGDRDAYQAFKEQIANTVLARTEELLPGLRQHIEIMDVATPPTLEKFSLNPRGTIYGSDNTPDQSLMQRLKQESPIPNVFLAGAWTFPGPGQASVLQSGETAAQMILDIEFPPEQK